MSNDDTIGVVRAHRWVNPTEQARRLEADGCRIIVSLEGGKHKLVTRDELLRLARTGTVLKFVHAMLLANVKARGAKAIRADYRKWEKRFVEERGAVVKDLESGLTTEQPGHRKAIVALTDDLIARHAQGFKSAAISTARKGTPQADFEPSHFKEAKAIWRNVKDYPTWPDTVAPLAEIVSPNGQKFTTARAYKLFGKRL
jgi:hypothetical protein